MMLAKKSIVDESFEKYMSSEYICALGGAGRTKGELQNKE